MAQETVQGALWYLENTAFSIKCSRILAIMSRNTKTKNVNHICAFINTVTKSVLSGEKLHQKWWRSDLFLSGFQVLWTVCKQNCNCSFCEYMIYVVLNEITCNKLKQFLGFTGRQTLLRSSTLRIKANDSNSSHISYV